MIRQRGEPHRTHRDPFVDDVDAAIDIARIIPNYAGLRDRVSVPHGVVLALGRPTFGVELLVGEGLPGRGLQSAMKLFLSSISIPRYTEPFHSAPQSVWIDLEERRNAARAFDPTATVIQSRLDVCSNGVVK